MKNQYKINKLSKDTSNNREVVKDRRIQSICCRTGVAFENETLEPLVLVFVVVLPWTIFVLPKLKALLVPIRSLWHAETVSIAESFYPLFGIKIWLFQHRILLWKNLSLLFFSQNPASSVSIDRTGFNVSLDGQLGFNLENRESVGQ